MSETVTQKTHTDYILPSSLVTKIDISRLAREVERVDNEYIEAAAREKAGSHDSVQPALSGQLVEFLDNNQLNIEDGQARSALVKELRLLKDTAPVIHMTFSVTADGESLQTLVHWLRESVHPQAVIDVGLQPALVAGVYLRTPNHVHDYSLRAMLDGHRDLLTKELEAIRVGK